MPTSKIIAISSALALGLSSFAIAAPAAAHDRYGRHSHDRNYSQDYRYDDRDYRRDARYRDRRDYRDRCGSNGTGGTIIGAIAGGLIGNRIANRRDKTAGTLIGGVIGAVAGRAIDKRDDNCGRRRR